MNLDNLRDADRLLYDVIIYCNKAVTLYDDERRKMAAFLRRSATEARPLVTSVIEYATANPNADLDPCRRALQFAGSTVYSDVAASGMDISGGGSDAIRASKILIAESGLPRVDTPWQERDLKWEVFVDPTDL